MHDKPASTSRGLTVARRHLEGSRNRLLKAVHAAPDHLLTVKPDRKSWSVAGVVEHLALLEELFNHRLIRRLKSASAPGRKRNVAALDAGALSWSDLEHTVLGNAPASLEPTGRWPVAKCLKRFSDSRDESIAYLESAQDLRAHVLRHPVAGPLDGYQWLLFIAAHTDRHVKQIRQILKSVK